MAIKDDDCIHSLEKGLYKFLLRSQIGPEAPCWLFTEIKKRRRATGNRREKREANRRRMRRNKSNEKGRRCSGDTEAGRQNKDHEMGGWGGR